MKTKFLFAAIVCTLVACKSTPEQEAPTPLPLPTTIEEAVSNPMRDAEMRARDQYRHPVETLKFFGLQPNMTVIEISPGNGWYTQILAPLLAANGHYVSAASPSSAGDYHKTANDKRAAWFALHPQAAGKIKTVDFMPPEHVDLGEGTADMVVTFRNVHNWIGKGGEQAAFNAFFKALKSGGILGVVEHRADPKKKRDPKAKSGYVHEQDVINMAKKAGFKLEAQSEINANPKDTKDHPEGVWTLPPALRLKEVDREKYLAIGESDRMTLKFVKPAKM